MTIPRNINHEKFILLVDKSMSIGPQKQDGEGDNQNVTNKSKKVVFEQLK